MAETIKGNVVIKTQMPVDEAKKQLADLQKSLDKLKIPDKLKDGFAGTFDGLNKELDKLQKRLNTGLNTKADLTGFEKTSRNVEVLYTELDKLMAKVRDLGDTPFAGQTTQEIERMKKEVEALQQSLGSIGKNNSQLAELKTKFGDASNATEALKKRVKEFTAALEIGDTSGMEKALNSIEVYAKRYDSLDKKSDNQSKWVEAYQKAAAAAAEYSKAIQTTESRINSLSGQVLTKQNDLLEQNKQNFAAARVEAKNYGDSVATTTEEISSSTSSILSLNSQVDSLVGRISSIVSIAGAFTMLKRAIRSAYDDVKELDAAMNSIAVVTDFTTQELWGQVDAYAELAQEMGVSLVGVYDVQKLYYQQGRDAADVASLTTDTLRFARIAEMDYADATDAMTVAINAFKLEASDATRVIDVYSQLAARAAVDQSELATAMSKVASMASSVGMSLETTSAFLTQIIETTRESPETAGTALKTILARFGEVKKLIDTGENTGTTDEGEEIDVNKIDTGLKSIGVRLTDTNGEMRALDQVIMEVTDKWDSLTSMQQRYIATLTAGSRQQSRAIALYSDSERLTELLGEAYSSAGAGAAQFEKTQESLESKLNNLHTAWTTFTTSITDSSFIKGVVDTLTDLLNIVNKLTDAFGPLSGWLKAGGIGFGLYKGSTTALPALEKGLKNFIKTYTGKEVINKFQDTGAKSGSLFANAFKTKFSDAYKSFIESLKGIDTEADFAKYAAATEKVEAARKAFQEAMDAAQDESYLASNLADAATAGAEEGLAKAKAEQAAIEAHNGKTLPKRIAEAYREGAAQGTSWGSGFKAATTEVKNTKLVQSIGKFFGSTLGMVIGTVAIGVALGYVAVAIQKALDPVEQAKKRAEQFQKEAEEIQAKIDERTAEKAELESREDSLTAAEAARLKILKQQTEELEKQLEAKTQQEYEAQKQGQSYEVVVGQQEVYSAGYYENVYGTTNAAGKTQDLLTQITDLQTKREQALTDAETTKEDLDKIDEEITALEEELQQISSQNYEPYLRNLDEEDKAAYYQTQQQLGVGFDALANTDEDLYNKIIDLNDAGKLTAGTITTLANKNENLKIWMEATSTTAGELATELHKVADASEESISIQSYKNAAEELKNIKKSVGAITDAVSNLYKDGYVDIDKLSTIVNDEAFSSLPSFENFFDIMSKAGKEDIPQVTAAMEQLLAEYISSDTVLTSLNDKTAGLYENMLRNMGVTNASEVIEQKLIQARAQQAVATLEANNELGAFMGTSAAAQVRLAALAKEYNTTEQAIAAYIVKTRLANANYLSTKASRAELSNLVKSLNLTAEALVKYQNLINLINSNDSNIAVMRASQNAAAAAGDTIKVEQYNYRIGLAQKNKEQNIASLNKLLNDELSKIESNVNVSVDTSQFNTSSSKSSSNTEKEIQKLSELYNAKKKVAEIEEKLSDLEEARKTLQNYDDQLANEHEQIEALKEKKKLTQDLIDQNEILRAQKLAMAKAEWAPLYNYDETTHEITLTQEYFNAINKNGKTTKKWSADVLNNFKDWVEEYDDIVEFSRDEQNILAEINTTLLERWESYRDDYIDLVNELADLYEKQEKDQIDALKEKYDKMKELDDKYLEELRKNIEARRDARNRENDVEEITKKQKRLNMLMRDTSGRNASEIVDLQKEIEDAQQDLIDEDVDRILDSLEDANDKDQENWDNAISKLEDQLEQDKENGKFIRLAEEALQKSPEEIKQLFKEFYETQGPYSQAEIIKMLKEVEDKLVGALDYRDGKNPTIGDDGYGTGSNGKYRQTKYLDPSGRVQTGYVSVANGQTYKDTNLTERIDEGSIVPNATNPNKGWKLVNGKGQEMTLSEEQKKLLGITGTTGSNTAAAATTTTTSRAKVANTGGKGLNLRASASASSQKLGAYPDGTAVTVLDDSNAEWWKVRCNGKTGYMSAKYLKKYAKGGLVDYTGPAWVDGSSSQPEAFLSAKDTKNFTELKELLAMFLREDRSKNFTSGGAQSKGDCNIYITVDQIASDYDIDEAVARVRQEIMNGSSYRNINLVNRRR